MASCLEAINRQSYNFTRQQNQNYSSDPWPLGRRPTGVGLSEVSLGSTSAKAGSSLESVQIGTQRPAGSGSLTRISGRRSASMEAQANKIGCPPHRTTPVLMTPGSYRGQPHGLHLW